MRARFSMIVLVAVAAGAVACTSGHGSPSSSLPPSTHVSTPVIAPVTTPSSTAPVVPTVPADVPTTGPNAHDGERPPVMPVLATQHTPAGAQAFAKFFIQTLDWAYATTSPTYMNHYYDAAMCNVCSGLATLISQQDDQGHFYIGNRFSNYRASPAATTAERGATSVVTVTIDVNSAEVVDHDGKYVNGAPAIPNFTEKVFLAWRTNWVVVYMV